MTCIHPVVLCFRSKNEKRHYFSSPAPLSEAAFPARIWASSASRRFDMSSSLPSISVLTLLNLELSWLSRSSTTATSSEGLVSVCIVR